MKKSSVVKRDDIVDILPVSYLLELGGTFEKGEVVGYTRQGLIYECKVFFGRYQYLGEVRETKKGKLCLVKILDIVNEDEDVFGEPEMFFTNVIVLASLEARKYYIAIYLFSCIVTVFLLIMSIICYLRALYKLIFCFDLVGTYQMFACLALFTVGLVAMRFYHKLCY